MSTRVSLWRRSEKARIEPHHRVLDLGCRWGTLAAYIHRETGARVKGIALAREQMGPVP